MICFVKQKVMNYFLRSALPAPRFKRRRWGTKCLIDAVEGTPGHPEELKGEGPSARAHGAELSATSGAESSCASQPGVQKSRGRRGLPACPLTPGHEGTDEREGAPDGRVHALRLPSAWEDPATACFCPCEEHVSGNKSWTFRRRDRVLSRGSSPLSGLLVACSNPRSS